MYNYSLSALKPGTTSTGGQAPAANSSAGHLSHSCAAKPHGTAPVGGGSIRNNPHPTKLAADGPLTPVPPCGAPRNTHEELQNALAGWF